MSAYLEDFAPDTLRWPPPTFPGILAKEATRILLAISKFDRGTALKEVALQLAKTNAQEDAIAAILASKDTEVEAALAFKAITPYLTDAQVGRVLKEFKPKNGEAAAHVCAATVWPMCAKRQEGDLNPLFAVAMLMKKNVEDVPLLQALGFTQFYHTSR